MIFLTFLLCAYKQSDQIGRFLKVLGDVFFFLKLPKCKLTFWDSLKNIPCKSKLLWLHFWPAYSKIWAPFYLNIWSHSDSMCVKNICRFYFDPDTSSCISFVYTGCGGNENRFDKKADCMAMGSPNKATGNGTEFVTAFPRKANDCQLPISSGICKDQVWHGALWLVGRLEPYR